MTKAHAFNLSSSLGCNFIIRQNCWQHWLLQHLILQVLELSPKDLASLLQDRDAFYSVFLLMADDSDTLNKTFKRQASNEIGIVELEELRKALENNGSELFVEELLGIMNITFIEQKVSNSVNAV